jgi:sugar transferase EpsL
MSTFYRRWGKRAFDLTAAGLAVLVLSPLLIILAAVVRAIHGSPIFFRQRRPGRRGEPFTILKFRTMRDALDRQGRPLPDAERLTGLGRWLRRSSADELPELFNVMRGDMSLVGPRPLLMSYLVRYSPEQARRHEVLPGITGWAQINGRNAISWEEKFKLDVWYAEHMSFGLDLRILTTTLFKVLRREGIAAQGHATMPEFMGTKKN